MSPRRNNLAIPDLLSAAGTSFELLKALAHVVKDAGGTEEDLRKLLKPENESWRLRTQLAKILVGPKKPIVVADPTNLVFKLERKGRTREETITRLGITRSKIRADLAVYFPPAMVIRASPKVNVCLQAVMPNLRGKNKNNFGLWDSHAYMEGVLTGIKSQNLRLASFDDFLAFGSQYWWLIEQTGLSYPHLELDVGLYAAGTSDRTLRIEPFPPGSSFEGGGPFHCLVYTD